MELIKTEIKFEKFIIKAKVLFAGEDLIIIINGGKSHVGAVGVSIPTNSIITGNLTAYTSIITMPSHKEDIVVKLIGEKIAKATGKKVTVIAGIHFDNVSEKEIETILNACKKLSEKIIEKLG
jgi:hydrogenase maturation factor